jgi:hypothetical protein
MSKKCSTDQSFIRKRNTTNKIGTLDIYTELHPYNLNCNESMYFSGESIAPLEGNLRGAPEQPDKQKTQMMSEFHRVKSGTILEESSKSEEDLTEMTKQSIQTTVSSTAPRFMPVNTLEDVQVRILRNYLGLIL